MKRRLHIPILVLVSLLTPSVLQAEDRPPCKWRPDVLDACRVVHGRLYVSNGIPLRIWVIGTKRVLAVAENTVAEDPEFLIPATLLRSVDFDTNLYGDYEVCPLSRERPEWMQWVCVDGGERLVQETFRQDGSSTASRIIRPKVPKRRAAER
jgi:hypothetical protein